MGGASSSKEIPIDEKSIVAASGSQRQRMVKDLADKHQDADEQDFYELFELQRYVDMTSETTDHLKTRFKRLILEWHPDKNPSKNQQECHIWTAKICLAKKILEDPDLKRRYDVELRQQRGEQGRWSSFGWYAAWGWNIAAMAGGLGLVIAGSVGSVFTGGASLTASIAGSALFTSGVKGAMTMKDDPNCSTTEFLKDCGVGALQGAVGGGFGVAAGPAMATASVGGRIAIAAGVGAASTSTGQVISDTTDILITKECFGETVKKNISKAKTADEVFSANNATQLMKSAALGAVVGGAVQGLAETQNAIANTVADDAANAANSGGLQAATKKAITGITRRVKDVVADGSGRATRIALTDAINGNLILQAGMFAAVNDVHSEVLIDRIRKLNPRVAHMLVNDASKAHFMLSRTNLQKDFADRKVVSMLEKGVKLCADNSLQSWGGPGWVERYVEDSKKTEFGILVLEGGAGFFESTPCCDELFAAKQAGINMTKLNGESMSSGEYLWVEITEELFDSSESYEKRMRSVHGNRYTPIHYRATLGSYYDANRRGTSYTYYCVVPRGHAARTTGADAQQF